MGPAVSASNSGVRGRLSLSQPCSPVACPGKLDLVRGHRASVGPAGPECVRVWRVKADLCTYVHTHTPVTAQSHFCQPRTGVRI